MGGTAPRRATVKAAARTERATTSSTTDAPERTHRMLVSESRVSALSMSVDTTTNKKQLLVAAGGLYYLADVDG